MACGHSQLISCCADFSHPWHQKCASCLLTQHATSPATSFCHNTGGLCILEPCETPFTLQEGKCCGSCNKTRISSPILSSFLHTNAPMPKGDMLQENVKPLPWNKALFVPLIQGKPLQTHWIYSDLVQLYSSHKSEFVEQGQADWGWKGGRRVGVQQSSI